MIQSDSYHIICLKIHRFTEHFTPATLICIDLIPCDSIWSTLIQFDPIWSNLIQFNPIWSILIFCIPKGKKRWIHRFTEHFAPASLSCISAGQSLVALGSKDGQIHVYESSNEFKCLRLVTILAHHTGAIHTVIFHDGKLLSGSDDMSVGIVNIMGEDSSKSKLILSKLLQAKICTKYRKHWKNYVSFQLSELTVISEYLNIKE